MTARMLLRCPVCGFERTVGETYTQADLMCPSEEHGDTELVAEGLIDTDVPPEDPDEPRRI